MIVLKCMTPSLRSVSFRVSLGTWLAGDSFGEGFFDFVERARCINFVSASSVPHVTRT